jgi:hypothetical protein
VKKVAMNVKIFVIKNQNVNKVVFELSNEILIYVDCAIFLNGKRCNCIYMIFLRV